MTVSMKRRKPRRPNKGYLLFIIIIIIIILLLLLLLLLSKLTKIASIKTRGTIIRSRARWYEHGERNSKYFYNLEKTNHRKKHITSIFVTDEEKITDPKEILEEEERFFKRIYTSQDMNLNDSERQGIISLIPKKNKNADYLKSWRPVSLRNVDYKIANKTIALRLEKILPSIIHPCQSGYVKGRFIGESIRLIADDIPGIAVFFDFEKAFDSVEWDFIQKCLESFNFGPNLRQWISVFYKDISSCVINNGVASQHFYLERGVHQGCPLSGILFVIAMELLAQNIRRSKDIKGIKCHCQRKPGNGERWGSADFPNFFSI